MSSPMFHIELNDLDELRILGRGIFGTIYEFKDKEGGKTFALKQMDDLRDLKFLNQVESVKSLDHPNIVKYHGYCTIGRRGRGIVMEMCQANLYELMRHVKMAMPSVINILTQIAEGINHLHANNILHRNLNPQIILIQSNKALEMNESHFSEEGTIKIGGFSWSRRVPDMLTHTLSIAGTIDYTAPEILNRSNWRQKSDDRIYHVTRYSSKVDIYSFGKIAERLLAELRSGEIIGEEEHFIHACCHDDPAKRPELFQIIQVLKQNFATAIELHKLPDPLCAMEPNDLDLLVSLGEGGFGTVYEWMLPTDKKKVALKVTNSETEVNKEVNLLISFKHEHILKCHGYCKIGKRSFGIAMELCQGDLMDLIRQRKRESNDNINFETRMKLYQKKITIKNVIDILSQIAQGLDYLHSTKHIAHRDLKPGNILVKTNQTPHHNRNFNVDEMQFKICDFGLSRHLRGNFTQKASVLGTKDFMAPEMNDRKKWSEKEDGYHITPYNMLKADIYSFGKTGQELKKRLDTVEGEPEDMAKEVEMFLDECCNETYSIRPEASTLILLLKKIESDHEKKTHDEKSLDKIKKHRGEYHQETIEAEQKLADTYHQHKLLQKERKLREDILKKLKKILEEDDRCIIEAESNLAATLDELEEFDEAKNLRKDIVDKKIRLLGEDDLETVVAKRNLAATLYNLDSFVDARQLQEEVLEKRKELLEEHHADITEAKSELALTLYNLELLDEARILQEDVLMMAKKFNHVDTTEAKSSLAATLHELKQYDEAKTLKEEVLDGKRKRLGENHSETKEAQRELDETVEILRVLEKEKKRPKRKLKGRK